MNDETLKKIGRSHSSDDIRNAFKLAREYEFEVINSDVIAGLPDETADDIESTIKKLIDIGANNITVQTQTGRSRLSFERSARGRCNVRQCI